MTYFFWSLPTWVVLGAILSGRANTTVAAILGLAAAIPIALASGPLAFGYSQLETALLRGLWIGAVISPYILGGMLFWQVASRTSPAHPTETAPIEVAVNKAAEFPLSRRRQVFFACLLVGPFAESATGFGVGMLGTVMLVRRYSFAPQHLMVFALMSQTMIPWGAMSSGTLLAAAYARMPAKLLSLYAVVPVMLLMFVWLPLFWRTAKAAGVPASKSECLREAGWVAVGIALVMLTSWSLGPETALLTAYGPLIVVHQLLYCRPDRHQALVAARKTLPYILLIASLALTRLSPELRKLLSGFGHMEPFADLPAWSPFYHAGSWLVVGGLLTAFFRHQTRFLGGEVKKAWLTGQHAVLTVFLFSMMAEVMTASGISGAFAAALFDAFGANAILITPPISGAFGVLTNSGNPANSLFLPSLVDLALQAGLSVPLVVALQHASATCLGFFSPVRMSIAAGLAGGSSQIRKVYVGLFPFAVAALVLLMGLAIWVVLAAAAE